ncbi:MAG TPA: tyrosine-type recombinase/integrase [Microlunatus sp.]|jgi:site-specific recombinase XerD|nr:tyrosine-type recombinase/integrase [Microlunatus sp.]
MPCGAAGPGRAEDRAASRAADTSTPALFTTETGEPINPRTVWDRWKKLLETAGVLDGRRHDARHTAATVLLILGVHGRATMIIPG